MEECVLQDNTALLDLELLLTVMEEATVKFTCSVLLVETEMLDTIVLLQDQRTKLFQMILQV
jgi:hypothetical protein